MDERCPTCGARAKKPHDVQLSAPLVEALELLANMGGEASVSEMGLAPPVYANFAMLRFFDLIMPIYREDDTRVRGRWALTELGESFLAEGERVKNRLWRSNGRFVRWHDGAEEVSAEEVLGRLVHPDPASPIWGPRSANNSGEG
jgi:hypothetical protein